MKQNDVEILSMTKVGQFSGEIDIARNENNGGGRTMSLSETTQILTQFVVGCVL